MQPAGGDATGARGWQHAGSEARRVAVAAAPPHCKLTGPLPKPLGPPPAQVVDNFAAALSAAHGDKEQRQLIKQLLAAAGGEEVRVRTRAGAAHTLAAAPTQAALQLRLRLLRWRSSRFRPAPPPCLAPPPRPAPAALSQVRTLLAASSKLLPPAGAASALSVGLATGDAKRRSRAQPAPDMTPQVM